MKKSVGRKFFALALLFTAIIVIFAVNFGEKSASADYDDYYSRMAYSFYFENYDVTYDIESNRDISVCEDLTVKYTGYDSTGFIKDIPTNGGELIRDVEVYELFNGLERPVAYDVYSDSSDNGDGFLCIDIGDYSNKTNETHTYRIKYRYCLTRAQEGKNKISLNLIGVGRASFCDIKNAEIKVLVPEGYLDCEFYKGTLYSSVPADYTHTEANGKVMLNVSGLYLSGSEGVSVNLNFKDGSITTYSEFTPYIFVIIAIALIVVAVVFKTIVFNKNTITPIVNFEAPDQMDPLIMGKLIDNSVDNEDITSMIFYWADKGYLKIDLSDENDPVLIRIIQRLPQGTPDYEATLFSGLFGRSDTVKTSSLANKFYTTVDRATGMVNAKAKNLYEKSSLITAIAFAIISGLILGLAPLIIGLTCISSKFTIWAPLIAVIPAFVVNGLCQSIKSGGLKHKNKAALTLWAITIIICLAFGAAYVVLLPSFIMGLVPRIILVIACCALSIVSAFIISRTREYTEKLNNIVGFKEFIRLAEKDQLEKMIESNPQFYYHVLPYAQVLGVSDKWEEKFADITIPPPYWCTNSYSFFEFYMFNAIIHRSMSGMRSHMCSRPSSSGSGGHGGFGGGHVGGGHGGGGFRGR